VCHGGEDADAQAVPHIGGGAGRRRTRDAGVRAKLAAAAGEGGRRLRARRQQRLDCADRLPAPRAEAVARAAPDGYTLFSAATPQIAITPALQKVPYDPIKDFAPISNVGSNPFVLSVNAKLPIKSVADFIAYVRARPGGQVTFGSGGVGTLNHLSMTMFAKLAGIDITHVPYKGGGPAMADLVAGHIQAMFANLSDALGQAGAGTIRLLAVSSEKRARQLPNVPTVMELGYPTFKTTTWNGLMGPAGMPKQIVARIAAEVARASKEPKYIERMTQIGVDAIGDTPEEFAATIAADVVFWGEAVKAAGLGR
jgi:tripartite-type tricarboxylate transporter receptor subunit TctC